MPTSELPVTSAGIGVGLWGLGEHARRNLVPALMECPETQLRGLTTRNQAILSEFAAITGARGHGTPGAMLEDDSIDLVVVAVPPGLHFEYGAQVLDAGRHLMMEKPLAANLEERRALISRASEAGLAIYDGAMFAHHPQFRLLASLLESGELGSPVSVTSRFGFPHLDRSDFRYESSLGGGALLDAGYYPIAATQLLLAGPYAVRAALIEGDGAFDVDVGGGALVTASVGYAFLDWGFGRSYRNEIEVWGRGGVAFAGRAFSKPADLTTSVRVVPQKGEPIEHTIPGANHFVAMFGDFARAIAGGAWEPLVASAAERSELMGFVERVARSTA